MADIRRVDYVCPECGHMEYMYENIIYENSHHNAAYYMQENVRRHKKMKGEICDVCGAKGLEAAVRFDKETDKKFD